MLEELGIRLLFPQANDPRFAPWVGIARDLHREPNVAVLGLVPVERNLGVVSAALQLGVAVHHLSARSVTLIDCNTVAPAWSSVTLGKVSQNELDQEVCTGVWVVARRKPTQGADVSWCEEVIAARRSRGHFVMCDLTGLAETGGLGSYYSHLDGVVSVVRSGATFEWRLSALHRQFPKHLDRGVLFVDT